MEKGLNLSEKGSWSLENAGQIAILHKYVLNSNFLDALTNVIKMVDEAQRLEVVDAVAEGMFRNHKPALEKLPSVSYLKEKPRSSQPPIPRKATIFSFFTGK